LTAKLPKLATPWSVNAHALFRPSAASERMTPRPFDGVAFDSGIKGCDDMAIRSTPR
jgi:hypothetical protein